MTKTNFVRVSTVLFCAIGLAHLYRALSGLSANVMGWEVPVELSWAVGLLALFLAYSGYRHWR